MGRVENTSAKRAVWVYGVAAILSLIGLLDALYLTIEHLTGQSVRCTVTAGCSEVLSSSYATIAGVPLAAFGALAYFTAFSLATLAAFGQRRPRPLFALLAAIMAAMSLWLLFVQAFVLHHFCQYCLLSAIISFSLAALAVVARVTRVSS